MGPKGPKTAPKTKQGYFWSRLPKRSLKSQFVLATIWHFLPKPRERKFLFLCSILFLTLSFPSSVSVWPHGWHYGSHAKGPNVKLTQIPTASKRTNPRDISFRQIIFFIKCSKPVTRIPPSSTDFPDVFKAKASNTLTTNSSAHACVRTFSRKGFPGPEPKKNSRIKIFENVELKVKSSINQSIDQSINIRSTRLTMTRCSPPKKNYRVF